jgi:hypothetical protein
MYRSDDQPTLSTWVTSELYITQVEHARLQRKLIAEADAYARTNAKPRPRRLGLLLTTLLSRVRTPKTQVTPTS